MEKSQGGHVWSITDTEKQWHVVHKNQIEMVLTTRTRRKKNQLETIKVMTQQNARKKKKTKDSNKMKNAGETYEEQAKKEVQLCTLGAPGFIMEEEATKATRQPCWRSVGKANRHYHLRFGH